MTQLNDDGTCTVLGKRLTTAEVELLLHDLAVARNEMSPQVPVDWKASRTDIVLQRDADIAVSTTSEEDEVAILLRHRGYGWIVCSFSRERAAQIGAAILKRSRGESIDVPGTGDGKRH